MSRVLARSGQEGRDWKEGLWTAVDLTATLGSVGGAIAFVLTQEAILVGLPVVLPLLALYASRKREKAVLEVCTHFWQKQHVALNLTLTFPLSMFSASFDTENIKEVPRIE